MREFKDLKIAVAGTGYVGLSIARISIWQFLSREAIAAGIAKVVIQVIFTPISNISSNAIMVGSSLPVSFINPV